MNDTEKLAVLADTIAKHAREVVAASGLIFIGQR